MKRTPCNCSETDTREAQSRPTVSSDSALVSRMGNAGMARLMRATLAGKAGNPPLPKHKGHTKWDQQMDALRAYAWMRQTVREEARIRDIIGDEPVLVRDTRPDAGGMSLREKWMLSAGAKKFLTEVLKDLYQFTFDLYDVPVYFSDLHDTDAGEYDSTRVTITMDRRWWDD